MFIYPALDPVALNIGPIAIHWYGLMYLAGFITFWLLGNWRIRHYQLPWNKEQLADLIFYAAMGVILGGRLGYMLFYNYGELVNDPLSVLRIWEGGMSFHGGLIGVVLGVYLYTKRTGRNFFDVADFMVPMIPPGLAFGRIGNFINGELWGRVTSMPWGVIYPHVDSQPRHPSQLYEFFLEGILLFILVWWYANTNRPRGAICGFFAICYALARIICEFFREPDVHIGYLAFGFTMGQLLSIPLLIAGIIIMWRAYHNAELS